MIGNHFEKPASAGMVPGTAPGRPGQYRCFKQKA
jgi:hypothetical protein